MFRCMTYGVVAPQFLTYVLTMYALSGERCCATRSSPQVPHPTIVSVIRMPAKQSTLLAGAHLSHIVLTIERHASTNEQAVSRIVSVRVGTPPVTHSPIAGSALCKSRSAQQECL